MRRVPFAITPVPQSIIIRKDIPTRINQNEALPPESKMETRLWFRAFNTALRGSENIFACCISAFCGRVEAFGIEKEDKQTIEVARDTQASMLPGFHFAVHS